jgi:hypothetical protein
VLPAARAEEILAAQRPVLEAAGFRVGLEIEELSVTSEARAFQEARATGGNSPRWTPLAVAAGPVRCRLPGHDLTITSATLTPEGFWLRYHGDAQEGDRREAGAIAQEVADEITELSITDDTGGTYLVPPGQVNGAAYGRAGLRSASGRLLWVPEGEFLAVPVTGEAASGGSRPAVRWLEFSAGPGQGTPPVRLEIRSPSVVPTGTTEPAWPTPAEAYLAELAPVCDWSIRLLRDRLGGTRRPGNRGRRRQRAARRRRAAARQCAAHCRTVPRAAPAARRLAEGRDVYVG